MPSEHKRVRDVGDSTDSENFNYGFECGGCSDENEDSVGEELVLTIKLEENVEDHDGDEQSKESSEIQVRVEPEEKLTQLPVTEVRNISNKIVGEEAIACSTTFSGPPTFLISMHLTRQVTSPRKTQRDKWHESTIRLCARRLMLCLVQE